MPLIQPDQEILNNLSITYMPVGELKPRPDNPRTHSKKQISQIARSMREFGVVNPVITGPDGALVAGHGRLEAAKQLGMQTMPVIRLDHLTSDQLRMLAIADNKLAELAGWDKEILKIEFQHLLNLDGFDVSLTGFEIAEVDLLVLDDISHEEAEEDVGALLQPDPISKREDRWILGRHRLVCGDALKPEDYAKLMDGEKAQLVFTDPPYNVKVKDIVGLGKAKHAEFAMASGEMDSIAFIGFLRDSLTNMKQFSEDGSIAFVCMDWRHIGELLAAGNAVYKTLLNMCVWNKTNGGMGSLYRSKHELISVFKNGTASHINNVQLGKHGRYRTNVWDYAGQNTFHADREDELGAHPTVKPVQLVADAILDCSKPGGIVLDPFGGSGTTLLAAEKTGREARLIEYEPVYVDLTIRRWQKLTGETAVHASTGKAFDQIAQEVAHD